MQTKFFSATVYRTTPGHGDTTVGITFKRTPSLTRKELQAMIIDLLQLSSSMDPATDPGNIERN